VFMWLETYRDANGCTDGVSVGATHAYRCVCSCTNADGGGYLHVKAHLLSLGAYTRV